MNISQGWTGLKLKKLKDTHTRARVCTCFVLTHNFAR